MRRIATFAVFASAIALAVGTSAAPALAAPAGHGGNHGARYYLALGDSLSVGIQPDAAGTDVPTDQGYPDQLASTLRQRGQDLRLVKLGCSGETTVTFIDGGICTYPGDGGGGNSAAAGSGPTSADSQLAAATQFLRAHRGDVDLVTIDIGANDLNPCIALGQAAQIQSCLTALIPKVVANLTTIMSALRQAGGSRVEIIGMRYYDPELADWLTGPAGQSLAQASVGLLDTYNGYLAGVYQQYGADVADVFTAFGTTDFTDQVTLPGLGTLPSNVATICQLTWECVPPPQGPNEHANAAGYRVIADAFLAADHPWARR
ncbi:MAG: SGNH/GDSL hydrolase family protein [Streptosporangiaceae bacterium]